MCFQKNFYNKRWIKFEETAETAERRWSKPHVPTLTQTSIEDTQRLIENGVILLGIKINSFFYNFFSPILYIIRSIYSRSPRHSW